MKAILAFLPLFRRIRRAALVTLLLSLVTLAAGIALLGLSGWFLTAAAVSTAGVAFNLFGPSAGVRGLSFLRILSRYGEKLSGHDATLRLLSDLRRWLFAKLFPLAPLGRRFGRGDLVSRLLGDVEALDTMFLVALGPISTAMLAGLGMTIVLAFVLPSAALVYATAFFSAALMTPVTLIAVSGRSAREAIHASSQLRQTVFDGVEGHQDLVVFGETGHAQAAVAEAARRLSTLRQRLGLYGALASGAVQIAMGVALVGMLVEGIAALRAGRIEGPLFAGLLLAVIASFEASAMLVRSATRLAGSAAAARRLQAIGEMQPTVAEPQCLVRLSARTEICFDAVRFGHNPQRPVFCDLTFTVRAGDMVAIAGPSGSGKSTIAQLLLRLADPQAGTIRFGGVDIRNVASGELRQRISLMTQDSPVFQDTIRANLLLGRPSASDADLWAALEATGLAELIRTLPGQLEAYAGEAGRTLSAGEARRLCLARTLLSPADVIVLDEPTSGLDQAAEAELLGLLPRLLAGRTVLVITHGAVPKGFNRALALRAGQLSISVEKGRRNGAEEGPSLGAPQLVEVARPVWIGGR